jgi:8-oxo-dGTP pyrophosphatase MutT (NUDIX family)
MKTSAGIILKYKDSILLCHPTNASWKETYSFPKGLIEDGEDLIDAAIRECFEETGIKVTREQIVNKYLVPYKKGRNYFKKVYLYQVNVDSLEDIGLTNGVVDKSKLQLDEVDWVGFISKEDVSEKIFWRFKPILHEIFN